MTLIFCMALFVPMQSYAAITVGENLFSNGGFESTSGYTAYGGWGGSYASLEKTEVHGGNSALKLNGGAGNPWVSITVTNLAGGSTVELSFWYKADLPERTGDNANAFFGIKYEGYVDAVRTDYAAGSAEPVVTEASVGEWTQAKVEYTLDERANLLVIYFRMYNMTTGTVYVDDAEFCVSKPPELSFEATTDQVFYYSDIQQTEGYAEVTLNDYFDDSGYTADFKFMDSKTQVHSAENVEFRDNVARFTYPLSLLKVKRKEYKILITVKDSDGTVLSEITKYVYKYDRPKSLSRDGVYTDRNGKEVKPVMNYHMSEFEDTEAWEAAVAAGINVVQYVVPSDINQAISELDALYEMGCYAAVVCYLGMLPAGDDANYERVFNQMSLIADHPAVFCWMTMDEPFLHNIHAADDLRKSYILLRSLNDYTPVYICECTTAYMGEAVKYCDIIAPDPYPGRYNSYGTFVSLLVDKAKTEAAKQDKLTMGILQCCTVDYGTPTALQVHSMILQNYLSGAKAHGWYAWEPDFPDIDESLHKSPYWEVMEAYHNLEEDLIYRYYVRGEYKNFNMDKPGDIVAQTGDAWYETWTDGTDIYGIVQNRLGSSVTAEVSLTSTNGLITIENYDVSIIYDGVGTPVITSGAGKFNVALEPYHAIMFKVDPADDIDFSRLLEENLAENGSFEKLTGDTLSDWTFENTTQSAVLVTGDSAGAHSGSSYLALSGTANAGVTATFEGEYGKTYMLEAMYKSDTANAAKIQLYDSIGRAAAYQAVRSEAPDEWTPVRAAITVGKTLAPTVRVELANALEGASVCFDSVKITCIEQDYGNMIVNSGFELDTADSREHQNIANWQSGNAVMLVDDYVYSGNTAMAVRQQNITNGSILLNTDDSNVTAEETEYVFSFWVNDSSADTAKMPWVRLHTYKMHSDASLTSRGDPITVTLNVTEANKWTKQDFVFEIPADVNYLRIEICAGAGWTRFDEFSLRKMESYFELVDSDGTPLTELPDSTGYITARAMGIEKAARLYIAQYKLIGGVERLVKVNCSTGGVAGSFMSCKIPGTDIVKGTTVIKAFLWTGQMQPDSVIILK